MPRLGSTAARLKLKGIDGGPHKRWSMWFNSTQREEPYLGLTCTGKPREIGAPLRSPCTGAAWLSSARVVRCWVKSRNERNPCPQLPASVLTNMSGTLGGLPVPNRRRVGTTSSHHGPYVQGHTRATMGGTEGQRASDSEPIPESRPQCGSEAATRLREAGIASNRGSATPR